MKAEIIISGFGGQGALFAGQLLAYAALEKDLHVTWFPSYGPEMRGGTAHCIVIISDEEIGSPVVKKPSAAIVMNIPSLEKYEPLIQEGGLLVVNSSLVDRVPERTDIDVISINANEIAEELGEVRMANLVLTGAMVNRIGILTLDDLKRALKNHIPEHRRNLLEANYSAIDRGASLSHAEVEPA